MSQLKKIQALARILVGVMILMGCSPTLRGRLQDSEGKLVASSEARVNITALQSRRTIAVTPVDDRGAFVVKIVDPEDLYLIEALVPGYSPASTKVTGKSRDEIVFKLVPAPKSSIRTIGVHTKLEDDRAAGGASLGPPSL